MRPLVSKYSTNEGLGRFEEALERVVGLRSLPLEVNELHPGVERFSIGAQHLATIIRAGFEPPSTVFLTPAESYQQAGFVVYPRGGCVPAHVHLPLERSLVGTPETLFVKRGLIDLDLFGADRKLACTVRLSEGDTVLLVSGGHGIRFVEDTILFEIKQGPYTGLKEKEVFG